MAGDGGGLGEGTLKLRDAITGLFTARRASRGLYTNLVYPTYIDHSPHE